MKNYMGEELQVWLSGKTLGCATSCSLEVSADEIDLSCKDSGQWGNTKRGKLSWTVTSDCLFTGDDTATTEYNYGTLFDAYLAGTPLNIEVGLVGNYSSATEADPEGHVVPTGGWTKGTEYYKGVGTITSLSLSADNGAVATYSVTISGKGALTHVTGE